VNRIFLSFAALLVGPAWGNPINISTEQNASAWTVSWFDGNQFRTGPGMQVFGTDLSFTSTSFANGVGVGGSSDYTNWNGVWFAALTFDLPSNALAPILSISRFWSDDRTVLFLNGVPIADRLVDTGSSLSGLGRIYDLLNSTNYTSYQYNNLFSTNVTSNLNIGGTNTLLAITNNVGEQSLTKAASTFRSPTDDRTAFRLAGEVTYEEALFPTPEPGTLLFTGLALASLGLMRRRG
jgi:hypothetical protein